MSADDPEDPLDKLAKRVRASKPVKKVARSTRTLMMEEPQFSTLQRYCKRKGLHASDVINDLITTFLKKVADDMLPSDVGENEKK